MLLKCHGLHNHYWLTGHGVDLCLDKGDIAGVCGESGSGKTLLLRAIADIDPSSGEVSLDGRRRDSFTGPDWRRQVVYVAAEPAWWAATIQEHFAHIPSAATLDALRLPSKLLAQAPQDLSTGERQRFALLRAMMLPPKVLLLDEPTSALDRENAHATECFLQEYVTRHDAAALWVSHDRAQLDRICSAGSYQLSGGVLSQSANNGAMQIN